jgi:nitrate/nitrite transporter NarK
MAHRAHKAHTFPAAHSNRNPEKQDKQEIPVCWDWFVADAPPEDVGLWTGFENFAGNLAGVLAPLLTGFLISRTGSYAPGFALAAIVLLAGIFFYWFIVGKLEPEQSAAS